MKILNTLIEMAKRIKPKIVNRRPPVKRAVNPNTQPKFDSSTGHMGLRGVNFIDTFTKEQVRTMVPNFNTQIPKPEKDRLYIIGGGPSVDQCDCNNLSDGDVMVVNRAIEYVDKPKYFITMDYTFIRDKVNINQLDKAEYKFFALNLTSNMREHKGVWYDARFGMVYQKMFLFNKVFKAHYTIAPKTGFGLNESDFAHGENSGFSALQAGILLGYKEIVLVGFDLIITDKTHFHGGYGHNKGAFVKRLNKYLMHYEIAFKQLPAEIKDNIYVSSPRSVLKKYIKVNNMKYHKNEILFQKEYILPPCEGPAPDIEPLPKENPVNESKHKGTLNDLMVVGYYTINTAYEQEAKKTIASCEKFGLMYDIIGIPNQGGWQANTRYKAKFMIDMLNKHKGMRLLYVDVDAIFHGSPDLFKNYSADIAVRWQDFRWRQNECLSGTIYMENNPKTMKLCQKWLNINDAQGNDTKAYEQWNLGKAIEEMRKTDSLIDKNLPPEYCQFDLIERIYPNLKKGGGVIQHYQASRRFRGQIG